MTKRTAVVLFSGGMDSTTLAWWLRAHGYTVKALSVQYGQRHAIELRAAANLAQLGDFEHRVVDLTAVQGLLQGSCLTDKALDVPDGHYAEDSMKATVVPNRNMLLLALAGAWAVSVKAEAVAYAAHAGDHTIYPDCRPPFIRSMREALRLCDWQQVELLTPFSSMTKASIVLTGSGLGVPYALTYSCYKGGPAHCGTCGTCTERREAFAQAGIVDTTTYA